MNTIPFAYQEEGVRVIQENGRVLLADEMGLGKTFQALLAAHRMGWTPMVVVCPPSLRYNWRRECQKHLGLRAEILQGVTAPSNRLGLRSTDQAPVHIIGDHADTLDAWMTHVQLLHPKLIVIDEAHRMSNRNSRRSRLIKEMGLDIPNAVCLSGTPLPNRPADLWAVLNFLWPEHYPDFFTFAIQYCDLKKEYGQWNFRGAKDLPKLHTELLTRGMIRRRKQDVFKDLPPLRRIVLPVPIDDRETYQRDVADLLGWIATNKGRSNLALGRLNDLKQSVGQKKLPYVIDWIEQFLANSDGKLLVFGIHHNFMKGLYERFKKQSVLIYGLRTHKERLIDEDSFQKDPRIRICFGNIHAAGIGLNLTAAHTVMIGEFPWKPSDLEQAISRAFGRVSDLHGVDVYLLTGINTIDEHIVRLLQRKQDIADTVVDGAIGTSDFDLVNQLIKILKEGETPCQ